MAVQTVEDIRHLIAERAYDALGAPFRLHGRSLSTGLDCVGLVAHAIKPIINDSYIPHHYTMRFDNDDVPRSFFKDLNFETVCASENFKDGDIVLIAPAFQQLHFIIMNGVNYIHAHAGVRRIVKTHLPILSPVKAIWRYKGE